MASSNSFTLTSATPLANDYKSEVEFSDYYGMNKTAQKFFRCNTPQNEKREVAERLNDILEIDELKITDLEQPPSRYEEKLQKQLRNGISLEVKKLGISLKKKTKLMQSQRNSNNQTRRQLFYGLLYDISYAQELTISQLAFKFILSDPQTGSVQQKKFFNFRSHRENKQLLRLFATCIFQKKQLSQSVRPQYVFFLVGKGLRFSFNQNWKQKRLPEPNILTKQLKKQLRSYLKIKKMKSQQFDILRKLCPPNVDDYNSVIKIQRSKNNSMALTDQDAKNQTRQCKYLNQMKETVMNYVSLVPKLKVANIQSEINDISKALGNLSLEQKIKAKVIARYDSGDAAIKNRLKAAMVRDRSTDQPYYNSVSDGIFPKELRELECFQKFCNKTYQEIKNAEVKNAFEVAQLESRNRTQDYIDVLICFLKQISEFKTMNNEIIQDISKHIRAKTYEQGQIIARKGDSMEQLVIIFEGKIERTTKIIQQETIEGGHKSNNCEFRKPYNNINKGEALTSLCCIDFKCFESQHQMKLTHNYVCQSEEAKCLILSKSDYLLIQSRFYKSELHNNIKFFKKYGPYSGDRLVLAECDKLGHVVFLRTGSLRVDKEIELDYTNYWPVGSKHWEVNTTKKKQVRTILQLKEGEFVGLKELMEGKSIKGNIISDSDNTTVIFLKKEYLLMQMNESEIEQLLEGCKAEVPEDRKVKINLYAKDTFHRIRNLALMNATNTNKITQCYREFYMESSTKKLVPWAHMFESQSVRKVSTQQKQIDENNGGTSLCNSGRIKTASLNRENKTNQQQSIKQTPFFGNRKCQSNTRNMNYSLNRVTTTTTTAAAVTASVQPPHLRSSKSPSPYQAHTYQSNPYGCNKNGVNTAGGVTSGRNKVEINIQREKINYMTYKRAMKHKDDLKNEAAELVLNEIVKQK